MTTTQIERMKLNSPAALAILAQRRATLEPCALPEHKGDGYTTVIAEEVGPGEGRSLFTNNRVLFFRCRGCIEEIWQKLLPGCPPSHRAVRGWINQTPHCHACSDLQQARPVQRQL